ncbi:MAG: transglycosylase SLT domain-containing protein [Luteimonas sp.]
MSTRIRGAAWSLALLLALAALDVFAQERSSTTPPATRNGGEIYTRFREGLADPSCDADSSARWRSHFAAAPKRLASHDDDVLALFGYVVDALREADLPTEYALIPFVESGYQPGARSSGGPAGLWQMIAITARNHHVPIRAGYDGRLSPVDSTKAAVRYLKTLHGMFAGDWRLAVMAYNAGEYRVFGALKRSGQVARSADPEKLVGLSGITRAYVRKLHALSCLLDQADDREDWMRALDRPVPVLAAVVLPAATTSLDAWAARNGLDGAVVRRLNPAFAGGRVARADRALRVLAPVAASEPAIGAISAAIDESHVEAAILARADIPIDDASPVRTHTVSRGESAWTIAHRYKLRVGELLSRNGLGARSVLRPGMVLKLDAGGGE